HFGVISHGFFPFAVLVDAPNRFGRLAQQLTRYVERQRGVGRCIGKGGGTDDAVSLVTRNLRQRSNHAALPQLFDAVVHFDQLLHGMDAASASRASLRNSSSST